MNGCPLLIDEKIPKIISVLNYESFRKDEHIIYFGEIGDKFYIILSGTVSIYKPSPKNMNMTLHEYVDYLGTDLHHLERPAIVGNFRKIEKQFLKHAGKDYYQRILRNNERLVKEEN